MTTAGNVTGNGPPTPTPTRRGRTGVPRSKSRVLIAAAVADGGLDRAKGHHFDGWGTPSLRRILIDMIEEYARHTGHADLIREAIDGRVGEDPPA